MIDLDTCEWLVAKSMNADAYLRELRNALLDYEIDYSLVEEIDLLSIKITENIKHVRREAGIDPYTGKPATK